MTDLEITKLCAQAMEFTVFDPPLGEVIAEADDGSEYDPLHDDEQAMELVKKFALRIEPQADSGGIWSVCKDFGFRKPPDQGWSESLNRAICECVAKMQKGKS